MAEPREDKSLEDEIFAVAANVEIEEGADAGPRVQVPWELPPPRDLRRGAAGFVTFVFVDGVMMYAPLMMSSRPSTLPQLVALLMLAFGLGGLLAWKVGGGWRPFGYGMMLGWVFLTLISVGFLTGLPL
ncbi:hypothetical protein [Spirillospora sp. CA-294931]|uniref:hypothetical protein n=1 Tax=Spirillospora sp. CA-294931 TaxID=3240042 RepID=UPI003D92029A